MGAKWAKAKAAKGPAHKAQESSMTQSGDEHASAAPAFAAQMSGRTYVSLDDAMYGCIWAVLDLAVVEDEQRAFLQSWLDIVFKPVYSPDSGGSSIVVSTDMANFELSVSLDSEQAKDVAQQFMETCGAQQAMLQHMQMVTTQLHCEKTVMWCRLKRMGTRTPSLDVGFEVRSPVSWIVADLLLPPCSDLDLVRDHSWQESLLPSGYGCSLIPKEPERYLLFDVEQAVNSNRNSLYSCLFFFKALGFVKPDDKTMKALTNLLVPQMAVRCSMGPRGLIRMAMVFVDPLHPDAKSLAAAVDFPFADGLYGIPKKLDSLPSTVHFAAEDRGFTVAIGFAI